MPISMPTSFNPYGFTSPGMYLANVPTATQSPQHAKDITLDTVEIGVKSLLIGRMVAKTATTQMQMSMLKDKPASALGLTGSTMLRTAAKGGLVAGGISLIRNGIHLSQGDINLARAGGNVGADLLGGTVGTMVAAGGASLGVKLLAGSNAFGMGTAGLIFGAAAFALADTAYRATGARDFVSDKLTGIAERWFDGQDPSGGV
ncbi:MAG: hypothetical protein IGS03_14590 [Candidatus Sericytochromatia bacterium]|nr:hypothetical protein [Candidatus Sericytochromatia bacterium]